MCFYSSWQHFVNMGSPGKMTITMRRPSKFCARNRSQSLHIFDLELISSVILGTIEPWPECQPDFSGSNFLKKTGLRNTEAEHQLSYQIVSYLMNRVYHKGRWGGDMG